MNRLEDELSHAMHVAADDHDAIDERLRREISEIVSRYVDEGKHSVRVNPITFGKMFNALLAAAKAGIVDERLIDEITRETISRANPVVPDGRRVVIGGDNEPGIDELTEAFSRLLHRAFMKGVRE